VDFFDPPLGVLTVPAHVPLAHCTVWAGYGIWAADDADDQITLFEGTVWTWINDPAEGFMAEHEAFLVRRSPTILALDDLNICPADSDGHSLHKDGALTHFRLREILVSG
jgi:hypothetical protein